MIGKFEKFFGHKCGGLSLVEARPVEPGHFLVLLQEADEKVIRPKIAATHGGLGIPVKRLAQDDVVYDNPQP